mgnify:CR=1 FL=1
MDRDLLRSAIAVDFLLVTIFYRGGSLLSCIFDHAAINMLGFMLPVRMEIGILQIYDLLCGCKSFSTAYDELELDTLGDKKTALWF